LIKIASDGQVIPSTAHNEIAYPRFQALDLILQSGDGVAVFGRSIFHVSAWVAK
jgi:hypothetical protein